jgi:uncharacterized membrane protein (UPF0182 family)
VRPLYLRASGGRIPELTRVIVAYQNQIVMEETLEAGLARLFGEGATRETDVQLTRATAPGGAPDAAPAVGQPQIPAGNGPLTAMAAQARGHYDRAIEAQRNGDWAKYGEELRLLGDVLAKMRQR